MASPIALAHSLASARMALAELKLLRVLRKYSPTQPRVPSGNPDGGQWTSGGGSEEDVQLVSNDYSHGTLIAEIPLLTGRRNCVYQFDFAAVAVPGPNYAKCPQTVPSSAVTHGRFLNDNWRKQYEGQRVSVNFTLSSAAKAEIDYLRSTWQERTGDQPGLLAVAWGEVTMHSGEEFGQVIVTFLFDRRRGRDASLCRKGFGPRRDFFITEKHWWRFSDKLLDHSPEKSFHLR